MSETTAVVPSGGPPAPPRGRLFTKGRLIVSLLLAVAGACLVIAFQEAADPEAAPTVRPAAVLDVFPSNGARVLRQERIGAQLAEGFTGELLIDGVAIPLDQLQRPQDPIGEDAPTAAAKGLAGLNEVSFTPGEGKEIARFRTGDHRATILFWDRLTASREQAETYTWSFAVT